MDRSNKVPVFPNVFPYNELLMTGRLLAKTRDWDFKYRGPILLYTSGRDEKLVCQGYKLNPKDFPHSRIVGKAKLVDVRPLTKEERWTITQQFNPLACDQDIHDYMFSGYRHENMVFPLMLGFFFEDIERLAEPVKIAWPRGAVTLCYLPKAEAEAILA
jgi:hypothetical protein